MEKLTDRGRTRTRNVHVQTPRLYALGQQLPSMERLSDQIPGHYMPRSLREQDVIQKRWLLQESNLRMQENRESSKRWLAFPGKPIVGILGSFVRWEKLLDCSTSRICQHS